MHPKTLGVLAVLLTAVLWGTTGTAATFAPRASPLAIGAAAMGVGGLLQALVAVPSLVKFSSELRRRPSIVLFGALSVGIYPLAFYSSMRLAGVAIGTTISLASAPIASAVLERVIDGTPLTRRWMGAATLGVIGAVLLCLPGGNDSGASEGETLVGIALGLVAGGTYAIYSWAVRRLMDAHVPRAAAMGAVFGVGGVLLIPVLVITGQPLLSSPENLMVATYMALVPMFLGYVLFGIGLARLRASTATLITLAEPAVAALLAVVVVGERLSIMGWTGLVVVAVSLMLVMPPRSLGRPQAE